MAIPVVRQWIEIATVNGDVVVHDHEIAVAAVVEVVPDLVHRDHDDDPGIVIVTVEKTRTRSEQEKWNVNTKENGVEKGYTILKRNI